VHEGNKEILFSKEECEKVIDWAEKKGFSPGKIVDRKGIVLSNEDIRRSKEVLINPFIPEEDIEWLVKRCGKIVDQLNYQIWNFEISRFSEIGILKYEPGDHFMLHTDLMPEHSDRKLGIIIQLSNSNDYEGGVLELGFSPVENASKNQGAMILFPSWYPHKVTPVTSGIRYCVAFFALGPSFR